MGEKVRVIFSGGPTNIDDEPGDYMIARCVNASGEVVKLYAEYKAPLDLAEEAVPDFERKAYTELKKEIIRQAADNGIAADDL